jgi:hypothetical protein
LYAHYARKFQCDEWTAFGFSVVVNVTFFLLFVQFYIANYLKKGKKNTKSVSQSGKNITAKAGKSIEVR